MKLSRNLLTHLTALLLMLASCNTEAFSQRYTRLDSTSVLAAMLLGDTISLKEAAQRNKQHIAQGEKAYKQIRKYIEKENYRKALKTFEAKTGVTIMYLGHSDKIYPFHKEMIDLYYEILDEEEAREKAINLRELDHAYMQVVIAGGNIPKYYFQNSNLLISNYLEQKDYRQGIEVAENIIHTLEQLGDTLSAPYAIALSNLGTIHQKLFSDATDFLKNEANDTLRDVATTMLHEAIWLQQKSNAIFNSIPEMKYSEANANVLFQLWDMYHALHDIPALQYLEQIKEIYEINGWEPDSRYNMVRLYLLFTYIQMGDIQKATQLHSVMKTEDEEFPSLEELIETVKQITGTEN